MVHSWSARGTTFSQSLFSGRVDVAIHSSLAALYAVADYNSLFISLFYSTTLFGQQTINNWQHGELNFHHCVLNSLFASASSPLRSASINKASSLHSFGFSTPTSANAAHTPSIGMELVFGARPGQPRATAW